MKHVRVPVKHWNKGNWGDLSALSQILTHEIVGEEVRQGKDFSFAGGHRVRFFKFKKNVHFKINEGVNLDISDISPGTLPVRRQGR